MILNIGNCPLCKSPVKWDTEEDKCVFVKSSCLCQAPFPKLFMKVWRTYADFIDITYAYDIWKTGHAIGYGEAQKEDDLDQTESYDEGYGAGHDKGYTEGEKQGYLEGNEDGYSSGFDAGYSDCEDN